MSAHFVWDVSLVMGKLVDLPEIGGESRQGPHRNFLKVKFYIINSYHKNAFLCD